MFPCRYLSQSLRQAQKIMLALSESVSHSPSSNASLALCRSTTFYEVKCVCTSVCACVRACASPATPPTFFCSHEDEIDEDENGGEEEGKRAKQQHLRSATRSVAAVVQLRQVRRKEHSKYTQIYVEEEEERWRCHSSVTRNLFAMQDGPFASQNSVHFQQKNFVFWLHKKAVLLDSGNSNSLSLSISLSVYVSTTRCFIVVVALVTIINYRSFLIFYFFVSRVTDCLAAVAVFKRQKPSQATLLLLIALLVTSTSF